MPVPANRLLIIDDDRKLCRLIQSYLEPMGYLVEAVHDGAAGLQKAREHVFQAIILDVMLPGMDGFEVLKQLRREVQTPVLMLTARGEEADRIVGLEIGADDYLPKTASPRELLARIRAVTRRAAGALMAAKEAEAQIVVGPIRVDTGAHVATLEGQPLELTPVEFGLLASLARSCGRVKSREQLLEEFADRHFDVFDRSIDVHISSLRKKLGDDPKNPRFIKTVRSAGYLLIKPGVAPP